MKTFSKASKYIEIEVVITGIEIVMHPLKVLFLPKEEALLVADLHLGKLTHFQKAGIPISKESELLNLQRLDYLIGHYKPKKLLMLGDLFHSNWNSAWSAFHNFVHQHNAIEFILVKGNHDILPIYRYRLANMKVVEQLTLAPLLLTHHPLEDDVGEYINVCGHVHPGVRLRGKGRQLVNLSCFHFSPRRWTLPAFGSFTGNFIIRPTRLDHVYVIAEQEVVYVQ